MNENISEIAIKKGLRPEIAAVFEIHDSISSTNSRAKELAKKGAEDFTVIIAEHQSAGHGRLGRQFFSPEKCGIYMSIILRPIINISETAQITSFAAVAVCQAIEELCKCHVGIKWVNDLFINGKKICGILVESAVASKNSAPEYVIVGIGIDVLHAEIPDELKTIISSIEDQTNNRISRNKLISEILNRFYKLSDSITAGTYMEEYKNRSILIGKKVKVCCYNETFEAIVRQIDNSAALIIEHNGKFEKLNAGEVSIRF